MKKYLLIFLLVEVWPRKQKLQDFSNKDENVKSEKGK